MESIELHELGRDVFDAFKDLSGVQDIASHSVGKRLISEEQRFMLWAHSLGLHNQGHSSLDYRVRDSVAVKSRLADILAELREHLENLVSVHRGERQPFELAAAAAANPDDEASDRDSDARSMASKSTSPSLSSGKTSLYEVDFRMESVAETLDALYSLAAKIRNPRNRPQRSVDELYKHIPTDVRKEFIQEREESAIAMICHVLRQDLSEGLQPEELKASGVSHDEILENYASPSNWLVRRTGIANARRKQQFVYWKEHAERISRGPARNASLPRPKQRQYNDAPAADNKQLIQTMQPDLGASSRGSLATSATRFYGSSIKQDDMKSDISHQSRVSTVMNLRGEKLEWPSPPVQTASSSYFTCQYCKIICPREYLATEAWCVHLIHDLKPYHCTFERCNDSNRIYGTRQEWLEHESLHVRVWHCAVHGEEFETQPEYITHLHEKHPERKAEYFSPELIAAVVGPSLRLHRDCPFCPTAFSEASALQKHVTFHLERLALLVLPADDEDENDKSGRASDSHEGQHRGRVGSIEGDFTDEEQLVFADIAGSTVPDQPEPKTDMATIQEAVGRREEEDFLSQWLADSEGADADPYSDIPAARFPERKTLSESQKGSTRWLSRMRQLNKELAEAIRYDSSAPAKPVRVAVLDTGFDDSGLFFDIPENSRSLDRLKGWKDFVDSSDHWQDAQGHGTHLVSLILSIAPRAELLVARIARNSDDLVWASENIAQAISWATEQRADIISMSFGYADDQPCIRSAILRSIDLRDNIIYFAAASNSGSNDSEAFPARLNSVISVRATDSHGQFEDFNPPRHNLEKNAIGTLGRDVPGAWKSEYNATDKYCSGTSVATAVAAGLAAVLLGYVQDQSARETFNMVNSRLRKREGMQAMFMELSRESQIEQNRYLTLWRMMGISDEERWAIFVATLSRL